MKELLFDSCYFSFRHNGDAHGLRVRVTPSLHLEWHLYHGEDGITSLSSGQYNILIPEQLAAALAYSNVLRVYNELLTLANSAQNGKTV